MPTAVPPAALRARVFRGSSMIRAGVLTPGQLRGPTWRRLFPDIYVHRAVADSHELRVRAAGLLLPQAVVTGCSAAVLWGVHLAGAHDAVEVTLPPESHPRRVPGLRARRAVVPEAHRSRRRGVAVTTPEATAVRIAAALEGDDAVVAVDRLIASGVVDLDPIRALAAGAVGPGSVRARRVVALADGRAESPPETRLRLLIGRSHLPAPIAQYTVRSGGRFVARVDFGWPEWKVAVEYDGLWHAEDGQFAKDRRRLNALRAAGWRVVFVTAADLHRPDRLLAEIEAALNA